MNTIRRLGAEAPDDAYRKAQRGALRRVPLSEAVFRNLERSRPELIVVDGSAVLVAEPRPDRIDLHYAFPDQGSFGRQFGPMLEQLVGNLTITDAPFGVNLRLTDRALRPYVEPALFGKAFEVTREWIRMERAEVPQDPFDGFPAGFTLRDAAPADVEAIVQLIYESFDDPTVHPRGWAVAIADKDRVVRLLVDPSGRAAALLHLRPEDARAGYVSELAVHPGFQRRGLGEALMHWSFAWFKERGLLRAALTTDPANSRAIALYRKLGFAIAQVGVDYRRSLDEDEVRRVLEKQLGHHITVRRVLQ